MAADSAALLRGLSVVLGRRTVLAEVDLTVGRGEVVALLGPSGSAKTTLLSTIAGFHPPSAGEVWLNGRLVATPARGEPPERREVAMVFQHYALWPHLTAQDTVAYPLRRRGVSRPDARRQAARLLEQLHVGHLAHRRPAELSGGEQQRVGLARALAQQTSLYLFDEPTAHLDTHLRGVFLDQLAERRRASGAAAIYATHDAEEALGLADRVVLIAGGRVQQVGTPSQVYAEPASAWAARMTGAASFLTGLSGQGVVVVRPEWARLGGDRPGRLLDVRFRGPHSDHLLETPHGLLLVRHLGPPTLAPGTPTTWSLDRSWPLPDEPADEWPVSQPSISRAGPE